VKLRPLLTKSRQSAYRQCPRYHHYTYDLQLEPVAAQDDAAMRFGIVGHAALEGWLLAIRAGEDADTAFGSGLADLDRAAVKERLDDFEHERAVAVFEGYHARWWDVMEHLEVLAVEAEFRDRLRNPATGAPSRSWDQGGKLDAIVRDRRDGRVWILEHKFTSSDVSPGSSYWQRLRIDSQVSIYHDGAAVLGYPEVAGCIYDVISRPAQRPLQKVAEVRMTQGKPCRGCDGEARFESAIAGYSDTPCGTCNGTGWKEPPRPYAGQRLEDETPAEFGARIREVLAAAPEAHYQRGAVVRFDHELAEARWDLWQTGAAIRLGQRDGRHPRNTDACPRMYGHPCPFTAICAGEAQPDDPFRFRRREHAHPELSPEIQAKEATDDDRSSTSTPDAAIPAAGDAAA
jgi:hypothetical protein